MTTDGLEQSVLTILRERGLFDIAARTHARWKVYLEAKYPRGPRGGLHPLVRVARKMQATIANFGPEALVENLLPQFVYAAERWQQLQIRTWRDSCPISGTFVLVCPSRGQVI